MNNEATSGLANTGNEGAEAARYALTRRLLPVLRHHMVVNLQPIGMIYEVLDRKMAGSEPDMAPIREGLGKINTLARSAIGSCLDVVTWLAPDPAAVTALGAGVEECLELLSNNFRFRGFNTVNEVGNATFQVSQSALREVLTAALMAATDGADGPVQLRIHAQSERDLTRLCIDTRPGEGTGFSTELAYRSLTWGDVEALAQAHRTLFTRNGTLVTLIYPLMLAAAPEAPSGG